MHLYRLFYKFFIIIPNSKILCRGNYPVHRISNDMAQTLGRSTRRYKSVFNLFRRKYFYFIFWFFKSFLIIWNLLTYFNTVRSTLYRTRANEPKRKENHFAVFRYYWRRLSSSILDFSKITTLKNRLSSYTWEIWFVIYICLFVVYNIINTIFVPKIPKLKKRYQYILE